MKKIIDISPEISPQLAVWPGDTPFSQSFLMGFSKGDHLDLSTINATVHLGAHTDAPSHYHADGETMESRTLDFYFGPCQIMDVKTKKGERIQPEDVCGEISEERVLFRTGSYPDPDHFNEDFCSLSPELIHFLSEKGVRLVGIDTPSVDPFSSKKLESHNAIFENDMAILEGVVLDQVETGVYTLCALPLKIKGSDASPVRAVLLS